jgi:hypothetical protein
VFNIPEGKSDPCMPGEYTDGCEWTLPPWPGVFPVCNAPAGLLISLSSGVLSVFIVAL